MHRTGPNGFNVPYGNYSNPTIYDSEHLEEISKLIKDVEFSHGTFEDSIKNAKKGHYLYFDPVYFPVDTKSFVGYNSDGFGKEIHDKLFKICQELKDKNIDWMMSNSDVEYVKDFFKDIKKYTTNIIECRRAINAKKPGSKANEVIITTYKV